MFVLVRFLAYAFHPLGVQCRAKGSASFDRSERSEKLEVQVAASEVLIMTYRGGCVDTTSMFQVFSFLFSFVSIYSRSWHLYFMFRLL